MESKQINQRLRRANVKSINFNQLFQELNIEDSPYLLCLKAKVSLPLIK